MKIKIMSKEDAWQIKKPRFNSHQIGSGPMKNKKKYSRKEKYRKSSREDFFVI